MSNVAARYGSGLSDGMFSNPKIPIQEYFGAPWTGKCRNIFWSFSLFYSRLEHLMANW
jgi:hypothetical protein